jgi:putative spermidine/putrescine transport system substrate-binding protein
MLKTLALALSLTAIGAMSASAADLSGKSWDDIVAQAKQEGQLNWYVWYLQDDLRRFIEPFEKEYGIKVTIPEGTQSANTTKLLAERERATGDIDVFSTSYGNVGALDRDALFMPLDILPKDDGRISQVNGVEGGDRFFAFWGNQTGIAYDPAHVSADDLPQTPEEFAAFWEKNPEKFGFNYDDGSAGPAFYQAILRQMSGLDFSDGEVTDAKLAALEPGYQFFRDHADQYVITSSNADSIIRVSDGELWMVSAWEDHLSGLQKRGEVRSDIKFYIPTMGMEGGANGVAVANNAPHAAAAAVFVNWLTLPETQTAFNAQFGTAPMNKASDDSRALVTRDQRANQTTRASNPLRDKMDDLFGDEVILER